MSVTALKNHRIRFAKIGECPPVRAHPCTREPKPKEKSVCPHCGHAFGPTVIRRHAARFEETGACPAGRRKKKPVDPLSKCDLAYIRREWT
jgi:hypothetical protein